MSSFRIGLILSTVSCFDCFARSQLMCAVVIRALRTNGISFVSFDQPSKRKDIVDNFINDASISVFLLHAERERLVEFDGLRVDGQCGFDINFVSGGTFIGASASTQL